MKRKETKELEHWIEHAHKDDLDTFIKETKDINLPSYLNELLIERNLQKADVIAEAQLPRTYGYQIFQGVRIPGRDKVLQLAFALKLNVDETNRFLMIAEKSPLYAKTKRDAIILYAIHKNMDLLHVNLYLDDYHMPILGDIE